jgi:hypothetical protein
MSESTSIGQESVVPKRRNKFSLVSNILHDLGLTQEQKLVLVVTVLLIVLLVKHYTAGKTAAKRNARPKTTKKN